MQRSYFWRIIQWLWLSHLHFCGISTIQSFCLSMDITVLAGVWLWLYRDYKCFVHCLCFLPGQSMYSYCEMKIPIVLLFVFQRVWLPASLLSVWTRFHQNNLKFRLNIVQNRISSKRISQYVLQGSHAAFLSFWTSSRLLVNHNSNWFHLFLALLLSTSA